MADADLTEAAFTADKDGVLAKFMGTDEIRTAFGRIVFILSASSG